MSPTTPLDVFHSIPDPYEAFGTQAVVQKDFMTCGLCNGLLCDPVACPANCTFIACISCIRRCQSCPQCRAPLPTRPAVTKHLQAILNSELKEQGVRFKCNILGPGKSPPCLWCCEREFDTLKGLEEHLAKQPGFQSSRASAMDLWRQALLHEAPRRELFGEAGAKSRLHLLTILEELEDWQTAEQHQRREDGRPRRRRSRSRTTSKPHSVQEDPLTRAVAASIAMSETMEGLRRQLGEVQRFVFLT